MTRYSQWDRVLAHRFVGDGSFCTWTDDGGLHRCGHGRAAHYGYRTEEDARP